MELKEPAHAYQKKIYTIQQYLEMEKKALEKHGYYNGEIFAMAGASPGIILSQLTFLQHWQ